KADSVVIAPGAVGQLTTHATVPGGYVYRATSPSGESRIARLTGLLAGALVVDSAPATPPNDRVFVIMQTPDAVRTAFADTTKSRINIGGLTVGRITFTINGRSWPNTERIAATVGDSLHWRIINATADVHPMHLHGFYFRIDGLSGPWPPFAIYTKPALGQLAVTQLVWPFTSMSMTWSPDRPGNWLFHCHYAPHLDPDSINAAPDDPQMRDMVGLVLGTIVADRPVARTVAASSDKTPRRLRLVAIADSDSMPAFHAYARVASLPRMRFALEEHGRRIEAGKDFSPELDLTRGEPVAITVVNRLPLPTSVHWHGIEIEDSYVDGVPGFSGAGTRLTPEIAPGDSFVARFTPPRSGTFMYHAHVDELREQLAGLEGAIIVRDPGVQPSANDHVFFLKGLAPDGAHPFEVNGRDNPDTLVLRVGQPVRLRFINLTTVNIAPFVALTARQDSSLGAVKDTMIVDWRPVAKDGADLAPASQRPHLARQTIGVGETYDFEYMPSHAGLLRLEVRGNGGKRLLLARVPIRVE
ncbi:MAG TPA: multicopper oxidase domain-containing protein, partial [Gemmatimonadaceae bacterium]